MPEFAIFTGAFHRRSDDSASAEQRYRYPSRSRSRSLAGRAFAQTPSAWAVLVRLMLVGVCAALLDLSLASAAETGTGAEQGGPDQIKAALPRSEVLPRVQQPGQSGPWVDQYAVLLAAHVRPGYRQGIEAQLVDYSGLRGDPRWPQLMNELGRAELPPPEHGAARMAFFINMYNLLAMDMVVRNWPLQSLRSLGSPLRPVWTHQAGVIGGRPYTLRQIEHDILRTMGDPRIHFAINCASLSCPDLRREPYQAEMLDRQLDDQTRRFLAQAGKGLHRTDRGLLVSPLFKWFASDFAAKGGVKAFIERYHSPGEGTVEIIGYLRYNWDLNAARASASERFDRSTPD